MPGIDLGDAWADEVWEAGVWNDGVWAGQEAGAGGSPPGPNPTTPEDVVGAGWLGPFGFGFVLSLIRTFFTGA